MPSVPSITGSIRKPFTANKRLFGLLTVALIVIGLFFAAYYSHIKSNQHNFRESKFQSLDSDFDIISRQLDNDIQTYNSQNNIQPKNAEDDSLRAQVHPIKKHIYAIWKKPGKSLKLDQAFDEYMVTIKDPLNILDSTRSKASSKARDSTEAMDDIYKSSLKGAIKPPDTLFNSNLLNMGVAMAIPEKGTNYQLFGRQYNYETALNPHVKFRIEIIGLVKADRYTETIRKIDPWIIALLTTFLLLALFGLPYFKMLFIAEDERLSSKDVISSGISVVVGAPIIMIVFLSLMNHYYDYYHKVPTQLKKLSKAVGDRFVEENNANVTLLYKTSLQTEDKILQQIDSIEQADEIEKVEAIQKLYLLRKIDSILQVDTVQEVEAGQEVNVAQKLDSIRRVHPNSIPDTTLYFEISDANAPFMKNLKFVSKIDSAGKVYYHIALIDKDDIKNTKNLGTRPYFKDFDVSVNTWLYADTINYVMRPVVSIEDQSEEAVYIVNNTTDDLSGYRIGASQLQSIHDPILPFGYQFVIVDEKGEVWFHSEEGRATLENFFEVCRQVGNVKSAVLGRINAQGLVNYRDEGQLFNVTPITGTNLSVIALYDIGLLRTRISEILTLSCIAVVLAIILMLVITVLSLIIRNPKLGLYKYDKFLFEFLTPKKKDRDIYILLSLLFTGALLTAILINLVLPDLEPAKVYLSCLLLAMWAYLVVYYTLHPYRNKPDIKFRVRDFLLLAVITFLNIMIIKINHQTLSFSLVVILIQLGCVCIILYNQLSEKIKSRVPYRKHFRLFAQRIRNICKYNTFNVHIAYRYWYSVFLFSWLLLVAVFPTYLIFEKVEKLIDTVWLRTDRIFMARKYMDKAKALEKNLPGFEGWQAEYDTLYLNHLHRGLYSVYADPVTIESKNTPVFGHMDDTVNLESLDGTVFRDMDDTVNLMSGDDPVFRDLVNNSIFQEFLWNIRPIYDERVSQFQALVYHHAQDTSWMSDEASDRMALKYLDKPGAVRVTRQESKETAKATLGFLTLKVTGIVLILALLFSLILFFVDRFFAFRFRHLRPNDFDTNQKENYVEKFGRMLLDEKSNSGLLLIGLPFSGKRTFALEILKSAGYTKDVTLSMLRLGHIDLNADISDVLSLLAGFTPEDQFNWEDHEVFIIEHLEHNIKSFNANHLKLKVISFLISKRKRVVLVSEVYPSQIFAFYEKSPEESGLPPGSLEDDFNSWRNILSAFPQVLIGITENREKVYRILGIRPQKNRTTYEETIAPLIDELGHSKFLPTLAPVILSKTLYETENPNENYEHLDRQRMVMHTQNLGHGYYNDIWNALPTRERYLLYDLAKDGFLNIKNRNSLFSLMKKGLIVWRDRPSIFNYSFKNFIVTSVSMNEALRLENKNRGKGTWGNARIVLYLIIITTIVFIALGRPELIKDFEALIGTLGGLGVVIPLVSKFLASGSQK